MEIDHDAAMLIAVTADGGMRDALSILDQCIGRSTGVVSYVKDSGSSGYGYHLAIDHGDGMVTLYAHCSKVYIRSGQTVQQGDVIAAVGSTGRSTGNHLHLEVRIGGKKVNPRQFLP